MRIVPDTNVFVSSIISPLGASARVFAYWQRGYFDVVVSEPILTEYRATLFKATVQKYHTLTAEGIEQTIEDIREVASVITPTAQITAIPEDPDDEKFLECAYSGDADYIITGDPYLLNLKTYQGIALLPPNVFVAMIEREHRDIA